MRFIAYWDRGKQHANIPIDGFVVDEGIVRLTKNKDGEAHYVCGFGKTELLTLVQI